MQVRLEISVAENATHTPARLAARAEAARAAEMQASFEAEPMVSVLKERFGAIVVPDSVQAVDPSK
jgi:hypothetical protein